jgi:multidrug efflux pump subunit AcrB
MSSGLNPIVFALRHPITVMAGVASLVVACFLVLNRIAIDIFPTLDLPVIIISQPYGGLNPVDMESQVTAYYEGHALYINGLHHVESRTIQGIGVVKLYFHPGTNMAQAMAETVGYVNRASGYLPAGTKPPFIVRFDTSNVPVGYLVVESEGNRQMGELSDLMLQRVRPIFGTLKGVSAPPPIGGNARTIIYNVDANKMRDNSLSPNDVVNALVAGNIVMPSGNVRVRDQMAMVNTNTMVRDIQELGDIPVRPNSSVRLRDLGAFSDSADTATGYAMVNGKRTVYLMVTKTNEASTLDVVNAVRENLGRMQESLPPDVKVRFDFDQSPYVRRAMWGVASEGALGAVLTGLMVLLFLRDWRSVLVVVLNIPLALMGAIVALYATGQTINIMTLGGLALAVGILIDEATVEVENIHSQMDHTDSVALAVRRGNSETAVPRLLAMLCVLAVFLPMFLMEGAARNMFVPLALAVGFSMITSYLLSSMFVPVVSVWLLRHHGHGPKQAHGGGTEHEVVPPIELVAPQPPRVPKPTLADRYAGLLGGLVRYRWPLAGVYLLVCALLLVGAGLHVGSQIFPSVDTGQFQVRLRLATGTRIELTEKALQKTLGFINEATQDKVETSVGFIGTTPPGFSNQAIYIWSSGPEEAILRVALRPESGIRIDELEERLRHDLPVKLGDWLAGELRTVYGLSDTEVAQRVASLRFSFGPADIINEVMSFGSPTPVEVSVYGPNQVDNLAYAAKVRTEMEKVRNLRDLQYTQAQDYPTVDVKLNRQQVGENGTTVTEIGQALLTATSSSRYVVPLYWADVKSGLGYQIQMQVPPPAMDSLQEVNKVPIKQTDRHRLLQMEAVGSVKETTTPAEYDRYSLRRVISLTANIDGNDVGQAGADVRAALARAGDPPRGVRVEVRGQIEPMQQMFKSLGLGLILAVVAIFLLLTAYFQSPKLAIVAVAAVPAVLAGVAVSLWLTNTTLNLQSFMGAIMSIGVAIANAILLLTFAEKARREAPGPNSAVAGAIEGARHRLRPILMTSCAMLAGMVPMALALGEGGEQTAPLGRAVIGGLLAATFATLFVLPSVFAIVQGWSSKGSLSLDPADPESPLFRPEAAQL